MTTLREAAQQALEALERHYRQGHSNTIGGFRLKIDEKALRELRAALAQQDEPDLSRCPRCNGPADNGFDRSIPPSPYLCTKCMAEPVEPVEPVAWECKAGGLKPLTQRQYDAQTAATKRHYTRIAPPQRTMVPLSEDEIWALYFSLPSDDFEQSDRVDFARAVEQASWEKNHGQA